RRMMSFRDFTKYELGRFVISEDGRRLAMTQSGGWISVWDLNKVLNENVYNPGDKANLSLAALWDELKNAQPAPAFHAIGTLRSKGVEAVELIQQNIHEAKSNRALKTRAINALERIDHAYAQKALAALAKDPDDEIAGDAQSALQRLGAKGQQP